MSAHTAIKINQKEYLKKYLSGDKEKKKKRKNKKHRSKVKIIDDDILDVQQQQGVDEELLYGGEDAPVIVAEYLEQRPQVKWRNIAVKEEQTVEEENETSTTSNLWGRKVSDIKTNDKYEPALSKQQNGYSNIYLKIKHEPLSTDRQQIKMEPKNSPPRHGRSDDQSLPHRKARNSENAATGRSPPRRRHSDDQSPPRRKVRQSQNIITGKSPSRHRRSEDQSPPRRKVQHSQNAAVDKSSSRHRYSDNQSPSLKKESRISYHNKLPPHNSRNSSDDQSPVRRRKRHSSSNQTPPRRRYRSRSTECNANAKRWQRKNAYTDQSSPRRSIKQEKRSNTPTTTTTKNRWAKMEGSSSPSPPPTHKIKTLDGKKAGLQDAKSLQKEMNERRQHEERLFDKMAHDVSGRYAEVQTRSTGRRSRRARDAAAEDPEVQRRKEALEQQKKEIYDRWSKGLKQIELQQARQAEMVHEAAKPLARYANDEDLERHLREREYADDPMLEYIRAKRKAKQKEAGVPQIPVYEGPYPENRFGIRPGYRWDGVDRSNGYEKRWFEKQNAKVALQVEAYKYSVEDM